MRPEMLSLLFFSALAGCMLPFQAALNAQLARFAGHPVMAALISFLVGTLALLSFSVFLRWPAPSQLLQAPWWLWTGGLMGALFVAGATFLAPRLGVATMLGAVIAGQMVTSLLIDHFGLLGIPKQELTPMRLLGAAILVAGVLLLRKV